jgi:transcriptional regulator with XRE-family HTH domain
MAAGMSLAGMSQVVHYSRSYLSNVENGRKSVTPELVAAYERVLNVELRGVPVGFDGTEFVDERALVSVRGHIKEFVALDNRCGGDEVLPLAGRLFRSLRGQVEAGAYEPALEAELYSTLAELAEVAGWLAYDAEQHDVVRRMNLESLYYARVGGDRMLELLTLQNMCMHAAARGRPAEALRLAGSVLGDGFALSSRLRALFLTRKARAMAQIGDAGAIDLLPEVRSLFLDGVADGDPPWAWWIDERELDWHQAMVERDLCLAHHGIAEFERSVSRIPAGQLRSHYTHRAYLLHAQITNRSWAAAEETVGSLSRLSTVVSSARGATLLRAGIGRLAAAGRR